MSEKSDEWECHCPAVGPGTLFHCPSLDREMTSRRQRICSGHPSIPAVTCDDYRAKWQLELLKVPTVASSAPPPPSALPAPKKYRIVRPVKPMAGPGTELKKLLAALGLTPISGCGCNARVAKMNLWGIPGCEANRGEILTWLREEQAKKGWTETLKAVGAAITSGVAFKLNPLDVAGSLLDEAIRRAAEPVHEAA